MRFSNAKADIYTPGSTRDPAAVLQQVTHLCVAAHQDDIEIMAYSGIVDCLEQPTKGFGGVVVTNGAGSPRTGSYSAFTDAQMQEVRREEQRKAADLGSYKIQLQLAHPSADVKAPNHPGVAADLDLIFGTCQAEVVYLHNPADKHDTHIAVLHRSLEAIRRLPPDRRPARLLACEVWRDLDWLVDTDKVALDSGRRPDLALELLKVFDSQVTGGKRYDLATLGRRSAHATFHTSHATDKVTGITWAMDLTPLVHDTQRSLGEFTAELIGRFRDDVARRIKAFV